MTGELGTAVLALAFVAACSSSVGTTTRDNVDERSPVVRIDRAAVWDELRLDYNFTVAKIRAIEDWVVIADAGAEGYLLVSKNSCVDYMDAQYRPIEIGERFMVRMESVSEVEFYEMGLWELGWQMRGEPTSYVIDDVVVFSEKAPILFKSNEICGAWRRTE